LNEIQETTLMMNLYQQQQLQQQQQQLQQQASAEMVGGDSSLAMLLQQGSSSGGLDMFNSRASLGLGGSQSGFGHQQQLQMMPPQPLTQGSASVNAFGSVSSQKQQQQDISLARDNQAGLENRMAQLKQEMARRDGGEGFVDDNKKRSAPVGGDEDDNKRIKTEERRDGGQDDKGSNN
jgi:hypothetical protein